LFSLLKIVFVDDPLKVLNVFSIISDKCIASANGSPCFCCLVVKTVKVVKLDFIQIIYFLTLTLKACFLTSLLVTVSPASSYSIIPYII
jgi:hypothetical protein